jgi:rubrerythrin
MDFDDIQRLLDTAIGREIAANAFYAGVAAKANHPRVKELFLDLASQEKDHEETLVRFKYDPTARMHFRAPVNYRIAEGSDAVALSPDLKPADAITLAMRRELEAMQFYQELADMATAPQIKEICLSLANMEAGHKRRLEDLFVEIGYPEAW